MVKCIIADDEQHAIDLLTSYINKIPNLELVCATTNPIEAFQYVQQHKVDVIFLDIHMPEISGIQFLKLLGGKTKVILTTAYPEYALEGYEHDVTDYLLKPILFERFLKATQKAINNLTDSQAISSANCDENYIFVKAESRNKVIKIKLNDILYIEAMGNYVSFYTPKTRIVSLITIKELEQQLSSAHFIRVHKSYIVPLNQIDTIDGNTITIGTHKISIGDTFKDAIFKLISDRTLSFKK